MNTKCQEQCCGKGERGEKREERAPEMSEQRQNVGDNDENTSI